MANQITIDILANTRQLTSGVNQVNSQLNGLNRTVGAVRSTFRGLLGTLGLTVGATAITQWVKDAAGEEQEFKRIAANFGKDAEGIVSNITQLSQDFKVDDGAIASYFNRLSGRVQVGNTEVLKGIVQSSLEASARFGQPAETYIAGWIRILRDGKIKASELGLVGAALRDDEAKEAFNSLKTTTDQILFLQERIGEGVDINALIGPYQELTYNLDLLKESIGEALLPVLNELLDVLFPANADGKRSLASWVDDLVKAILIFYSAKGVVGAIKIIKDLRLAIIELGAVMAASRIGAWLVTTTAGAQNLTQAMTLLWAALSPAKKVLAIGAILIGIYKLLPEDVRAAIEESFRRQWELIREAWKRQDWKALGKIFTTNVINGMFPIVGDFVTIANDFYTKLKRAWKDKEWEQFGKDIVAGIIKGLIPGGSGLATAIESLASWAKRVWKRATGTSSPSKVFAGYGVNLVEGLALGINKSRGIAERAVLGLAGTISDPMGDVAFAGIPSNRGGAINITINAGLGTDPYELGRAVRAALNKFDGVNGR